MLHFKVPPYVCSSHTSGIWGTIAIFFKVTLPQHKIIGHLIQAEFYFFLIPLFMITVIYKAKYSMTYTWLGFHLNSH